VPLGHTLKQPERQVNAPHGLKQLNAGFWFKQDTDDVPVHVANVPAKHQRPICLQATLLCEGLT